MNIAVIDIVFAALVLILVIRCALKGFIEEVMSMASLVLGIFCSVFFFKNGAAFIRERFDMNVRFVPEILAFIAIFIIVFILVRFVEYLLRDIINRVNLGGLDRFLGAVFGLLEGITLTSLLVFLIYIQPLFDGRQLLSESIFSRFLLPLIGMVQKSVFTSLG